MVAPNVEFRLFYFMLWDFVPAAFLGTRPSERGGGWGSWYVGKGGSRVLRRGHAPPRDTSLSVFVYTEVCMGWCWYGAPGIHRHYLAVCCASFAGTPKFYILLLDFDISDVWTCLKPTRSASPLEVVGLGGEGLEALQHYSSGHTRTRAPFVTFPCRW